MDDHLQKIRTEHPGLNPTETYTKLSEAMMPEVAEQSIDYAAFINDVEQYAEDLNNQLAILGDREKPQSAGDLLENYGMEWLGDMEVKHAHLNSMFSKIKGIARDFPAKDHVEKMVDERIKSSYPQFHKEYLEHQESLKAEEERLAGQDRIQDEPAPTLNKNHLQTIRAEYPYLTPTETYAKLSEAMMPEVVNLQSLFTGMEHLPDEQCAALRDEEKPHSPEEWVKALKAEYNDLDSLFEAIQDSALNLPDKARREEMVDERIRSDYPQFHAEYLEHQQWLKINAERLARQEQRQSGQDQTRNQDGLVR